MNIFDEARQGLQGLGTAVNGAAQALGTVGQIASNGFGNIISTGFHNAQANLANPQVFADHLAAPLTTALHNLPGSTYQANSQLASPFQKAPVATPLLTVTDPAKAFYAPPVLQAPLPHQYVAVPHTPLVGSTYNEGQVDTPAPTRLGIAGPQSISGLESSYLQTRPFSEINYNNIVPTLLPAPPYNTNNFRPAARFARPYQSPLGGII